MVGLPNLLLRATYSKKNQLMTSQTFISNEPSAYCTSALSFYVVIVTAFESWWWLDLISHLCSAFLIIILNSSFLFCYAFIHNFQKCCLWVFFIFSWLCSQHAERKLEVLIYFSIYIVAYFLFTIGRHCPFPTFFYNILLHSYCGLFLINVV